MEPFSVVYCAFVQGINRSPVDSPHKGKMTRIFDVSLLSVWTNCWMNYYVLYNWPLIWDAISHFNVAVMKILYLYMLKFFWKQIQFSSCINVIFTVTVEIVSTSIHKRSTHRSECPPPTSLSEWMSSSASIWTSGLPSKSIPTKHKFQWFRQLQQLTSQWCFRFSSFIELYRRER